MGICNCRNSARRRFQRFDDENSVLRINSSDALSMSKESLQLTARLVSGASVHVVVHPNAQIAEARRLISDKLGVPASRTQLVSNSGKKVFDCDDIGSLLVDGAELETGRGGGEVSVILIPVSDSVFVCGGCGADGQKLAAVERFDVDLFAWESVTPMARGRDGAAAVSFGRNVLVFGGAASVAEDNDTDERSDDDFVSHGSAERFHVDLNVWKSVTPLLQCRAGAAAAIVNGQIYVCGGDVPAPGWGQSPSVQCFALDVEKWSLGCDMLEARSGAAVVALGAYIYVFGGHCAASELETSERFDTVSRRWEPLPIMSVKRAYAGAAVLGDLIYVCGGWTGLSFLNAVEIFDPNAWDWQPAPSMLEARAGSGVATLGTRIYVCGGGCSCSQRPGLQKLNSVECFDVTLGVWQALPPLSEARFRSAVVAVSSI